MAVTLTVESAGAQTWIYMWSGTSRFDVWEDGVKTLSQTTQTQRTVTGPDAEEPPIIEVTDADLVGEAESLLYSPLVKFQWRGDPNAAYYAVQRFISSAWTDIKQLLETGLGYYSDATLPLDDDTNHDIRVTGVDDFGTESERMLIDIDMVRNPDAPVIDITYAQGTGLATIAARV